MQIDENFDSEVFSQWIEKVKELCVESGHLEVALITIGEMLANAPHDEDGLWLDRTIADALNLPENEPLRHGFEIGLHNSRGAHVVDTTGTDDKELAQKYRQKANDMENAGFSRLATTLRKIAQYYDKEAKSIIAEYQ